MSNSPSYLTCKVDVSSLTRYNSVEPPLTRPALEIIMLFASVRRSLFRDSMSRLTFLRSIIIGVQSCLSSGHGLNDEDTYNMMCQLLGRLKVCVGEVLHA